MSYTPIFRKEVTLGNILIMLSLFGSVAWFTMIEYHKLASTAEAVEKHESRLNKLEDSQIKLNLAVTVLTTTINDEIQKRNIQQ